MQVWSNANWELFHYPQTADRRRLTALARDRNAAQKHVWRAEIVLLSACRQCHSSAPRFFDGAQPCIEKIEHFGFVLPVIQL